MVLSRSTRQQRLQPELSTPRDMHAERHMWSVLQVSGMCASASGCQDVGVQRCLRMTPALLVCGVQTGITVLCMLVLSLLSHVVEDC
jgi:hypothetical protein